jgi:hypothetical protein
MEAAAKQLIEHDAGGGRDVQGSLLSEHRNADVGFDALGQAARHAVLLVPEHETNRPARCPVECHGVRRSDGDRVISGIDEQ